MSNILTIGYYTEGQTDERFLHNIIRKTFEALVLNCNSLIDVYEPMPLKLEKKTNFVSDAILAGRQAFKRGINVLCFHIDSDSDSPQAVLDNKINPAYEAIEAIEDLFICKNIVAVIPVYMTEAWMLADKQLLKEEIGTNMSDEDLGLTRHPENIANPKATIEKVLEIAQQNLPKRRSRLTIGELYQTIGQSIPLEKLETLNSYREFKSSAVEALKKLNYLN